MAVDSATLLLSYDTTRTMDINSIYTFFKGLDYSNVFSASLGVALLKGVHSLYQRKNKVGIMNDADVIAEISGFDLETYRISRFQPTHNYDAAYECFEAMCIGLNDKKLYEELNRLKDELKRIAEKAKETTDSVTEPESDFYNDYVTFGWDTPPPTPRYRNVDEDVKAWKNLFTTFEKNAKKYTNKVKVLA